MPTSLPLLASATQSIAQTSTPSDPISFQTALLVIIAGAVLVLAKNQVGLNRRLAALAAGKAPASPSRSTTPLAESAQPTPFATANAGIAPHIVAAISAAIHTTLNGRHRIVSVGQICPSRQAWSAEGRRQVFQSHKFR